MIFTNLLSNMVVLTLHSTILTNTPAFQEYAFREMFSSATNMSVRWKLDLPSPLTTNMVTDFHAVAYPSGIGGEIVLSNRFAFSWMYGGLPNFDDKPYLITKGLTPDVKINDAILEQWMNATNYLTMDKAQKIAELAMLKIGLPLNKLGFDSPQQKEQRHYTWKDGKVYPLPYYEFYWDTDKGYCNVHVSGIVSNVIHLHFTGYPYLRFEMPTNYFEMLGLPTNAVFVHHYPALPNQPPRYELRETDGVLLKTNISTSFVPPKKLAR
jgi:hypothetical protein